MPPALSQVKSRRKLSLCEFNLVVGLWVGLGFALFTKVGVRSLHFRGVELCTSGLGLGNCLTGLLFGLGLGLGLGVLS